MIHKDFLGIEITNGDYVVGTSTAIASDLKCFKVIDQTPKMVRIVNITTDVKALMRQHPSKKPGKLRYGKELLKVDAKQVTFHFLTRGKK